MQFKYRTDLETGGDRAHICLEVDGDIVDPHDQAFIFELLEIMIQYDKDRLALTSTAASQGAAGQGAERQED